MKKARDEIEQHAERRALGDEDYELVAETPSEILAMVPASKPNEGT